MNLGDGDAGTFIAHLDPHTFAVVPRFWLVALAVRSMIDVRAQFWEFFIKCKDVQWRDITDTIDIVCSGAGIPTAPVVHEFVACIRRAIRARHEAEPRECEQFFALAQELCFHCETCRTRALEHAWMMSPFARDQKLEPPSVSIVKRTGYAIRLMSVRLSVQAVFSDVQGEPDREVGPPLSKSVSVQELRITKGGSSDRRQDPQQHPDVNAQHSSSRPDGSTESSRRAETRGVERSSASAWISTAHGWTETSH
jgi:hypothetical protein